MDNEIDTPQLVHSGFRGGLCEEEVFKLICRKRGLNTMSYNQIAEVFERAHYGDPSLQEEIGDFYYGLICTIVGDYLKFKHATFCREYCDKTHDVIIDNRFLFVDSPSLESFAVMDTFANSSK
jgi:hypothetical protein